MISSGAVFGLVFALYEKPLVQIVHDNPKIVFLTICFLIFLMVTFAFTLISLVKRTSPDEGGCLIGEKKFKIENGEIIEETDGYRGA